MQEKGTRELLGVTEMPSILVGVVVTEGGYNCQNSSDCTLKTNAFYIGKLCFNKTDLKSFKKRTYIHS